ncbi:GH20750 [Drosophila grimshawi]|uniref:Receptor expression-enhancing protein n=2 Tax=Drosophila grimshawi TaxID=7222 RepID=B4J6L7_DROGR|nr:GH20750 [Drosophila grimshawi]
MCFFSFVTRFLVIIFGTLLPARNTHLALQQEKEELIAWTKYWIVYACLMSLEIMSDTFFTWLPLYVETKLLIVLWMVISAPSASVWVFDVILNPLMGRYMHRLNDYILYEKRHLLADALSFSSQLGTRSLHIVLPMISSLWKWPTQTADDETNATFQTKKAEMERVSDPQTNIYYDATADDESHDVTLACSHSHTQLLEYSRKPSFPELAMKAIETPNRRSLNRHERKPYVYEQLNDDAAPKCDDPRNGIDNLLKDERLTTELQQHPILRRRERSRYQ